MSKKSVKQLEEEVSQLLDKLESSEYDDIDQLLEDYKAAQKLLEQLEKTLKNAENSIKNIKEK